MNSVQLEFADTGRPKTALCFIAAKPDYFRDDFADWLRENWALYTAFERQALRVYKLGRKHYGANTIIEYMRHSTMLKDKDAEFKLNDKWTSSIARLFAMMNPLCADLFEFRERQGGVVKGKHQAGSHSWA